MTEDEDTRDETVERIQSSDPEARARALQSLLVEKGLLSTDAVDEVVSTYEEDVGPLKGAQVVARAWTDSDYKERLLEDGTEAIAELGIDVNEEVVDIIVAENTPDVHNVVVCTLCSCYPWTVLGLPPTWYKTPAYRSGIVSDPRETLREEFGLDLDESVDIEVWDSNSEMRYMVLPQRPDGTEDMDEDELVELVTRNSMIGVERLETRETYAADGGRETTTENAGHATIDATNVAGVPQEDGDPVFEAPWQARAFAIAVALTGDGERFAWEDFQRRLVAEVQAADSEAERGGPESVYYEQWLAALERLLIEEGTVSDEEFRRRAAEFGAGDRDASEFVSGEREHVHSGHGHHH